MNLGHVPRKWSGLAPGADAIVDVTTGRRVVFSELDDLVRRLANGLLDIDGVAAGERVSVLSRNTAEYQALYFAAARTGIVLQPLNWRLGIEELSRTIADVRPRVLVASSEFADVVTELQRRLDVPRWLTFGEDGDGSLEELVDGAADHEPPGSEHIGGDDPWFILSTGGTTGASKGVVHSHRSVLAGAINQTVAERVVPTDVYMLTGQMFHIPVVLAMNYLAHGCPLVLLNFEARTALEVIEAERVSAFLGITTMLNWMMAEEGFEKFDLSSLRSIQYGGGPMPSRIVRQALEQFPGELLQGYGQTEGTTMTFLSHEDHRDAIAGVHPERLRSCGRAAFLSRVAVVDTQGREVPRDGRTAGEIVVRSEANMLRYWERPEQTAQTLRDGWMYTGDLATWDVDGYVFIVDRAKDMIISGGENIYSVQVEEAIAQHVGVLECAVIGVPDDEWGESVMAYVVPRPGHDLTRDSVIAEAARHLASYQKPRHVEFVDELPKAPTGKILKRTLREPHWEGYDRRV